MDFLKNAAKTIHAAVPKTVAVCNKCKHEKVLSGVEVAGFMARKGQGGVPCDSSHCSGVYYVREIK
jgi:hypothetical protein